uniref:Fibrocystin-L isoform X1 n=1 Tax=Petromyzon marinus TaxID=7757 RepID=A0AAJ7T3A7_PETMA|nr:fibrocystin-L isoform X1 [Petromyzon marinus]
MGPNVQCVAAWALCLLLHAALVQAWPQVFDVEPRYGSLNGATRLTISGTGFAQESQVSFGDGDSQLGNAVFLVSWRHAVPCDVEKDSSHENIIICYTRPLLEDQYSVRVTVDSVPIRKQDICKGVHKKWECTFNTKMWKTPYIESISPTSGPPGTVVTLRGNVFTSVYGNNVALSTNGKSTRVQRAYAGGMPCELLLPNSDSLYRLELDNEKSDKGYLSCNITSTYIGHLNVSFILSDDFGRSLPDKSTFLVSALNKLSMFQSYAEVAAVSPAAGSLEGGTLLTVTGRFFDQTDAPVRVLVGGRKCLVTAVTDTQITCRTQRFVPSNATFYTGGRGLRLEIWNGSQPQSFEKIALLNASSPGYALDTVDATWKRWATGWNYFTARFSGFFVPPENGSYEFYVRGDDKCALFLSPSGDPADKVKVAYSNRVTHSYFKDASQRSPPVQLVAGQPCYLELDFQQFNGLAVVEVATFREKTIYTEQQTASAINHIQLLRTSSVVQPEIQVVSLVGWRAGVPSAEVQELTVSSPCLGSAGDCSDQTFRLAFARVRTVALQADARAEDVRAALAAVLRPDDVSVERADVPEGLRFTVTFASERGDFELLQWEVTPGSQVNVSVRERATGSASMASFSLRWDGRLSAPIPANATPEQVQAALEGVISSRCPQEVSGISETFAVKFFRDYETASPTVPGENRGQRTLHMEAFCGRYSLKNPAVLYNAGDARPDGTPYGNISLSIHRQLCVAMWGNIAPKLGLAFTWRSKDGASRSSDEWFDFALPSLPGWQYVCVDLLSLLRSDQRFATGSRFLVWRLGLQKGGGVGDFAVDAVYVGQVATTGSPADVLARRVSGAAPPLSSVLVQSEPATPGTFTVTFTPLPCGHGLPVLEAAFATRSEQVEAGVVEFRGEDWPPGAAVRVERVQAASPPISGSFSITAYNTTLPGLPHDVSAEELQAALQSAAGEAGQLAVTRDASGSCSGHSWTIKWLTAPGAQPLLQVDGAGLRGINASVSVTTVQRGGLLQPIQGDSLRTIHSTPQVEVFVNNVPSKCVRECGYAWRADLTPVVTAVQPDAGSHEAGTVVTVSGSGFSADTDADRTMVSIGGSSCLILSLNESVLECRVRNGTAGRHVVAVYVAGRGLARHAGGTHVFSYALNLLHVNPASGSAAGGTGVSVSGAGFGTDARVDMGGVPCEVVTVTPNHISCLSPPGSPGEVNVMVRSGGVEAAWTGTFTYVGASGAAITAVSPSVSGVAGGSLLNLTGVGLGAGNRGGTVTVGEAACLVQRWTETAIDCLLPSLPPAVYPIHVSLGAWGYVPFSPGVKSTVEFVLRVTDVQPRGGSLYGGTRVTITGDGFSSNATSNNVTIGGVPCVVLSSSWSRLECLSLGTATTHTVTNRGIHRSLGEGYEWSAPVLDVFVGDTVVWRWSSPPFLQAAGYRVYSVANASTSQPDGTFASPVAASPAGSFSYTFSREGRYFYTSGAVNSKQLELRGAVSVRRAPARTGVLALSLAGIPAQSRPASASRVSRREAPSPCAVTSKAGGDCGANSLEPDSSLAGFSFSYDECFSPSVTDISPQSGTIDTQLRIVGTGFAAVPCANEVTVGGFPCEVDKSSDNEILCRLNPRDTMNVGTALPLSLIVNNLGAAVVKTRTEMSRRFALLPLLLSVSPGAGSLAGRTRLTLEGSGFGATPGDALVLVGGRPCAVVSVNYTRVECDTAPSSVELAVEVGLTVRGWPAACRGRCNFSYSAEATPTLSAVSPAEVTAARTLLTLDGSRFGADPSAIRVFIGGGGGGGDGGGDCVPVNVTDTQIVCQSGSVRAGSHPVDVQVWSRGRARSTVTVHSLPAAALSPTSGSVNGGTALNLVGNGFAPGNTTVSIGGAPCEILTSTPERVTCRTPARAAGLARVVVRAAGVPFPMLKFNYSAANTPVITSIAPATGTAGRLVTIAGAGFGSDAGTVTVLIGSAACALETVAPSRVTCRAGEHPGGTYGVFLQRSPNGVASSSATFHYQQFLTDVSPSEGSFGGQQKMNVSGSGYDPAKSRVLVCGRECPVQRDVSTSTSLYCLVPPNNGTDAEESCAVRVETGADGVELPGAFSYRRRLTPVISGVSPARGGTAGGTRLTIAGARFSAGGEIGVSVGGTACIVRSVSDSEVVCMTEAHSPSQLATVRVHSSSGDALPEGPAEFLYVDVWSSRFTWGGDSPPEEGSFAVITANQTVLLDQSTPVLKMLLIQGGRLVFEEKDLELQAENILITDGGALQVGTEEAPFQHKAIITLHGHIRSPELPMYGAKTLGVRHGVLDLHGRPVPVPWTRLAETAEAGSTTLRLQVAVTWAPGDSIVIATTGGRHSQRENEQRTIAVVSADGRTVTLREPLAFRHLGVSVGLPGGRKLQARAEVGLLTRNVVVRGSEQVAWSEHIQACPEGFNTGEFATQTCFQGRFGEEIGSDQFGGCIMFHAPRPGQGLALGRIEHVEIYHAGQAFRLGRYPIHWHLMGDVAFRSYVRGCALHHTFNRAITIHNTHQLLVERNVAYNVMGGAYFIEDGIEQGNVLQHNLAVFVRQSTSLLNDDVTPAGYWITNPNNTVRHNAAAGGTHFGFWYRMHEHPDGPSFDRNVCQKRMPLGEFFNNTVHSQGWFGLWIFEAYFPMRGGGCSSVEPEPARFDSLTVWNCEKGAEWVNGGALQFHNFLLANNENAGVESKRVISEFVGGWGENAGALLKDVVVVGHLDELGLGPNHCTVHGLILPFNEGLTVSGAQFVNFDRRSCAVFGVTSIQGVCIDRCGGWSERFERVKFINSPNKAKFRWEHEVILHDMDGSLTGNVGSKVVARSDLLDPAHCKPGPEWNHGNYPAMVCDASVRFHRLAFNRPSPSSLEGKNVLLTNAHGTSEVPFLKKRLTHQRGWMALLPSRQTYRWAFQDAEHITNISYTATFYGLAEDDYVIINHNLMQAPDKFFTNGLDRNNSVTGLSATSSRTGDWFFNATSRDLYYMVSGNESGPTGRPSSSSLDASLRNQNVMLQVLRCFYEGCIVPKVKPVPPNAVKYDLWSNSSFWLASPENDHSVPAEGSNVTVPPGSWLVLDVAPPVLHRLTVYGVLEVPVDVWNRSAPPLVLNVTYLSIQGGRFIAGREDSPLEGDFSVVLRGDHLTPDWPLPNGPNQGSKVIGVFGGLDLHGTNHSVYKTKLGQTAAAGSGSITLASPVDWKVGSDVVISTSSYDSWQTETRRVTAISADGRTLSLNATLQHSHKGETHTMQDARYTLATDVGLLTRNVRVLGHDQPAWYSESFGARVLVSAYASGETEYRGFARISNVEFYHSGQEGYREPTDPRYSVAFLGLGQANSETPSYVRGCSFHHGFAPAIGVFSTDGVDIDDNVVHFTVGEGIRVEGGHVRIRRNLVTLSVWPGTYQDRLETNNLLLWPAAIQVHEATDVVLQGNVVAGFERLGFRIDGEPCPGVSSAVAAWSDNEVHGGLFGVYMNKDGYPGCSHIQGFLIWSCWDYGIYFQVTESVRVSNVSLVDNGMGLMSIIYSPLATSHKYSQKTVLVQNSLVVGTSPSFSCSDRLTNTNPNVQLTMEHRSPRPATNGRSGICWPTFASGHNRAPEKPHAGIMSYNAISGMMLVEDVVFAGFGEACSGKRSVAFMTNPLNEDLQHPVHTRRLRWFDAPASARVFIHRPDLSKVNPSDCVDMDCDAKKKALLRDLDGSLLGGSAGAVVPQSEYEWDGDPRHGLGDYRIPRTLLTRADGSRIPVASIAPNKGVVRDATCVLEAAWQAWRCSGLQYEMLVIESLDPDTETRRLSPVALLANGYVDLINGPQDHGWCTGYTCQRRISLFHGVVAANTSYSLHFTSTSPQHLRLMMLNAEPETAVRVGVFYSTPQRLDVYVDGALVAPGNAQWNAERTEYTLVAPSYEGEFVPAVSSSVAGANYFERGEQTLHVVLRGGAPVEVRVSPMLFVSFDVPAMTLEAFYSSELVPKLALLLGVPADKLRATRVVREDGGARRRRRRRSATVLHVEIAVSGRPPLRLPADDGDASSGLTWAELQEATKRLSASLQLGNLSTALGVNITGAKIIKPMPPAGSVAWDKMASVPVNWSDPWLPVPELGSLVLAVEPMAGPLGQPFLVQPALRADDRDGNCMEFGVTSWSVLALLKNTSGEMVPYLNGTKTIAFSGCWANFSDLSITQTGEFVMEFVLEGSFRAHSRAMMVQQGRSPADGLTASQRTVLILGLAVPLSLLLLVLIVVMIVRSASSKAYVVPQGSDSKSQVNPEVYTHSNQVYNSMPDNTSLPAVTQEKNMLAEPASM